MEPETHGDRRTIEGASATPEWNALIAEATRCGARDGEDAAGWTIQDTIGGRVSRPGDAEANARRILDGYEDGDPEVMDALPALDLSGQWADGPTEAGILEACGVTVGGRHIDPNDEDETVDGEPLTPEDRDEIVEAYRAAWDDNAADAVLRACRSILGLDGKA